jgi:glycosyltransferase involved in cell wall biosynthesis
LTILLLNQAFYPDVVSSGQHASDLAVRLAALGHQVIVVSSDRAYDDPSRRFTSSETWNGVQIRRVATLGLGKRSKWTRGIDFGSFLICCLLQLARLPKVDVAVAMTSPPLIAFIAALFVACRGGKLVYWVLDLNPDEAIAAGWLRQNSGIARILNRISLYTFHHSARIVVLDRFMKARVLEKGVDPAVVQVIPPWSHDGAIQRDIEGRAEFRRIHGLEGKFVVMYSGNHSPCHPLASLVEAAGRLKDEPGIVFCFVGGGSEHAKVRAATTARGLQNVLCLPYQPIARLAASLSAADLHAVVMGDPFVGIVHPCKIYNILQLGLPVLYIGPSQGHIPDMIPNGGGANWFYSAAQGDTDSVVQHILSAAKCSRHESSEQVRVAAQFSENSLLFRLTDCIESLGSSDLSRGRITSAEGSCSENLAGSSGTQ